MRALLSTKSCVNYFLRVISCCQSCCCRCVILPFHYAHRCRSRAHPITGIYPVAAHTYPTQRKVSFCFESEMDFSQIQLIYSAEGNANLVVALPQLKKVLRLPKADISSTRNSKCDDHHQLEQQKGPTTACDRTSPNGVVTTPDMDQTLGGCCTVYDDEDAAVCPEDLVAFVSVVARFIGQEYVNIPEIVNITSEADRRRINNFCRPFRPAHRLDKEFCGQFGLLLPDATLLPETLLVPGLQHQLTPGDTFAVDIKPKQGWLLQDIVAEVGLAGTGAGSPSRKSFLNPFNLKASTRCRYCTMQFPKLRSRKVARRSAYCPIDMFSGKPLAMRKSLNALLECPQNNLRIFQNGQLIYGDQAGLITLEELKMNTFNGDMTTFQDLIINCLLRNYMGRAGRPGNCVLGRILNIQLLAKKYITQMCWDNTSHTATKKKTYRWLKKFLSRGQATKLEDLTPLEQYLLAATFLDCSIIVAFKEIAHTNAMGISNHPNVVQVNGRTFLTKVTVLDLDPKPDNHFQKYVKNTNLAYACAETEN